MKPKRSPFWFIVIGVLTYFTSIGFVARFLSHDLAEQMFWIGVPIVGLGIVGSLGGKALSSRQARDPMDTYEGRGSPPFYPNE